MSNNEEQIAYWNGQAGSTWVEAQDRIDNSLKDLSEQAIACASPQPGEKVLDVGCGCGTTSIEISRLGADVTGVDISAPMLELASKRAAELDNTSFEKADASAHPFNAEYDLLFSRFGIMFFSDPVSAFKNLRTALKPDGRMMVMCWQSPGNNPWMSTAGRIVQPFLAAANPEAPAPDPKDPGPFAFANSQYFEEILNQAGFKHIEFGEAKATIKLGNNVDEVMEFQTQIGPLSRALSELDGDNRTRALAAARAEFTRLLTPDGVSLDAAAWLVSARTN